VRRKDGRPRPCADSGEARPWRERLRGVAFGAWILLLACPLRAASETSEIYLVPFSHLDFFWGGTREECLARGNRIIAKAVRLSKQFPEFRFLIEDDDFLANYVESHLGSSDLAELKRLVKEGRVEIAPLWTAMFQGLPDGEVHSRNLLYGKRYARAIFGVDPLVAHLADMPDYTPQYPQILAKAAVPFAVMTRMGPTDHSLFRWKAPNGSSALVWNTLKGYGWGSYLTSKSLSSENKLARLARELSDVRATTPGPILMHWGTDLWAPTEDLVTTLQALNKADLGRFLFATPSDFFRRVTPEARLADISGEINSSWPNVVSSLPHLWPLAIPATNSLLSAEKFAAINYALGYADYPQARFDFLWKKPIESMDHNHDGQGGQIGDGRKRDYAMLAIIEGGEILRDMLRNIAERTQIPVEGGQPIVVFNPSGWAREDLVRAHVTLYGNVAPGEIAAYRKATRLLDEKGRSVPFYVREYSENISRALELVFIARDVPPVGYRTYYLTSAEQSETWPLAGTVQMDSDSDLKEPRRPLGADVLENKYFRLSVDKATGRVTLWDKDLGREVVKDMEIAGVEERGGNYIGIEPPSGRTIFNTIHSIELEENNPVRAVLRVTGQVAGIGVIQRLILYAGLRRVDIENTVEWREPRFIRVQQLFPVSMPNASIHYGVPFGANDARNIIPKAGPRAVDEIKAESWKSVRHIHDWIHSGAADWGLTIATDHQLVRLEGDLIRAEMVRGTRFTSVKVVRGNEVGSLYYPPQGTYVFRYSLSVGPGDWRSAKAYRIGMDFNNPLAPISVVDEISSKPLPPTLSFCSLKGESLVISALKKAETGSAVVLRAYEMEGAAAESLVEFLGKKARFREVNLLEEGAGQEQETLQAAPYEIKTVKLSVPKP